MTVQTYINQLVNRSKLLRIPSKGRTYVGDFVLPAERPKADKACLSVAEEKLEPVKKEVPLAEEKVSSGTSVSVAPAPAAPVAVDVQPTANGVQLSITLNINLGMQK